MVVIQEQQATALYLHCKCSSTDHGHMEKLHFSGATLEKT